MALRLKRNDGHPGFHCLPRPSIDLASYQLVSFSEQPGSSKLYSINVRRRFVTYGAPPLPEMSSGTAMGTWAESVSAIICLASAFEGRWPVASHAVSSSQWQCTVSVFIIYELARGADGTEVSKQISDLAGI